MIIALGNNIFKLLNEIHRLYERFSFWTKEVSENKPVRNFEASETFFKKVIKILHINRIMSKINFIRTLVFKTWKWSQREFETSLILFLVFILKWIQRSGGNLTSWSLANSSPHWESVYNALKAYRASWNSGKLLVFRKEKKKWVKHSLAWQICYLETSLWRNQVDLQTLYQHLYWSEIFPMSPFHPELSKMKK